MAPKSSGLEPEAVRSKTFAIALRGYELEEIDAFLQRAADALEALSSSVETGAAPGLSAESVTATEFTIGWRGADREEVDRFMVELATELSRPETEGPELKPAVGALRTTWRPKAYSDESKAAQAKAIRETNSLLHLPVII